MKNKAVFLDRDGVVNIRKKRYVTSPEEFELISDVDNWLKLLSKNNFKLIIITNQSMIARGISTKENLSKINLKKMNRGKIYRKFI